MNFKAHRAKKCYGQHWLNDKNVISNIINASKIKSDDRILEIGPGKGCLTEFLLKQRPEHLYAIEIDKTLVKSLRRRFSEFSFFSLIEGDFLKTSLNPIDGIYPNKVIANIPYNITGPILFNLLGNLGKPINNVFDALVLLMQREVADRILAKAGQSTFSSLSVKIQLLANSKAICDVPPSSFSPPPKVHSKVILIEPLKKEKRLNVKVESLIDELLKCSFLSRRKKLKNTLLKLYNPDMLNFLADEIGISLDQRPQELSTNKWVELANAIIINL